MSLLRAARKIAVKRNAEAYAAIWSMPSL